MCRTPTRRCPRAQNNSMPGSEPTTTEVVVHCGGVKQAARLLSMHPCRGGGGVEGAASRRPPARVDRLQPRGGASRVRMRFVHAAEFMRAGTPLIFRDGGGGGGAGGGTASSDQLLGFGVGVVATLG